MEAASSSVSFIKILASTKSHTYFGMQLGTTQATAAQRRGQEINITLLSLAAGLPPAVFQLPEFLLSLWRLPTPMSNSLDLKTVHHLKGKPWSPRCTSWSWTNYAGDSLHITHMWCSYVIKSKSSCNYTTKKKAEQFMPLFLRGHQLHWCYLNELWHDFCQLWMSELFSEAMHIF